MKFLYVTTIGLTMCFFKSLIKELIEEGNTVDIACNESDYKVDDYYRELGCRIYPVNWTRSPLSFSNIGAIKELKRIVQENRYDIVHCHTPIAGACTRLACKSLRKNGVKVFYTAHGFHFYKGAPLLNWLIYYPIEKSCSRYTDVLITINREDYELARQKMKAKRIEYVPGVGIDVGHFRDTVTDRTAKRKEFGFSDDDFLLLSVGELNANKNHQIVINALAKTQDPHIHYVIAGEGELHGFLEDLARKLGVADQVHLIGYRNDVADLYKMADVDVFPSIREGLGLAALEGMAAGLPLICSDNRGSRSFAINSENSIVCDADKADSFAKAISLLKKTPLLKHQLASCAEKTAENYDVLPINMQMIQLYNSSEQKAE